jgi:hypothetical protein
VSSPTYTLRPDGAPIDDYLAAVSRLADEVLLRGERLSPILEAYGDFVEALSDEPRRGRSELLVDALLLGVLWRSRGCEANDEDPGRQALVRRLVIERKQGAPPRRDGRTASLLVARTRFRPGDLDPSLAEIVRLLDWLLASGDYDAELGRLEGLVWFLGASHASAGHALSDMVRLAVDFERMSERALGAYTVGVDRFLLGEFAHRGAREDSVQCSRHRIEYHLNMVGAEILNRAWRADFLARRRHLVVLPSCSRGRPDRECHARRVDHALCCSHCEGSCPVSAASRAAERSGARALAVVHGSDFDRLLESPGYAGDDIAILGVACVPSLLAAGWRARAAGLPAQCVLLESSGCDHWLGRPKPTRFDLEELVRLLTSDRAVGSVPASRIAEVA